MKNLKRFFTCFGGDNRGGAAVEFGMVAPLLVGVVIAMGQVGGSMYSQHAMRRAINSGAETLMTSGATPTQVRDVVLAGWKNRSQQATVSVTQYCACGQATAVCTTTCSSGDYPQQFTRIAASEVLTGPTGQQTLSSAQLVRTR